MTLRPLVGGLCGLLLVVGRLAAGDMPLDYRPAPDSDEAGLWMANDEMEKGFQSSPLLVRDPALNAYVRGVVCKLAPERCAAVRIYILDLPYFNAAMSPNGAMQVWTGLLARVDDEAELAFVLGHEFSHYKLRHTLALWQRARNTSGFATIMTVATGGIGALVGLAAVGTLSSYSRDEEREADASGMALAVAAGYDPAAGGTLWQAEAAEETADTMRDTGISFFRSHPETEERLATMKKSAAKLTAPPSGWIANADGLKQAVGPWRNQWLAEIVALGHYDGALVLLHRKAEKEPDCGEFQFLIGEVYRRRNRDGDAEKALAAYRAAIAAADHPPEAWRGLGLVALKSGDKTAAGEAFGRYLAAAPKAGDRAMIEYYLKQVRE